MIFIFKGNFSSFNFEIIEIIEFIIINFWFGDRMLWVIFNLNNKR